MKAAGAPEAPLLKSLRWALILSFRRMPTSVGTSTDITGALTDGKVHSLGAVRGPDGSESAAHTADWLDRLFEHTGWEGQKTRGQPDRERAAL